MRPASFSSPPSRHEIHTIQEMGWAGQKNGALLQLLTASNFEVLITADQNLQHQQRVAHAGIGVIVLVAVSNRLDDLTPLVPAVIAALAQVGPGHVVEIGV